MLASVLSYVEGRTLKKPVKEDVFIPNYLDEPRQTEPTLEQQEKEFKAFANKLKAMTGK